VSAIKIHHTGTDTGSWDGPANESKLKLDQDAAFYGRAYAWRDADGDETKKSSYKFIHHVVDADGNPGAANVRAGQTGIGVLNGGRGGTTIPAEDRQGVYNHLAAHLRDADVEPPELKALSQGGREEEGEVERRSYQMVEVRASEAGTEPRIEGIAAVYNQPTLIESWVGSFTEIIEPGFFESVLENDVRALWNHNTDMVLGRTKSRTLKLNDRDEGLGVTIDPPDTQLGRDAVTSIRRGDVDQMSFAFSVKHGADEWKESEGVLTRTLKRGACKELYDVSPVSFPAYPQTSVGVRSMLSKLAAGESLNGDAEQELLAQAERSRAQRRVRAKNRKRFLEIKSKF